ncbi:Major vault protein [Fasciola gigantica]|uniref:Major vault protein n=1 Tax=Fasciola gigantica TaxID=46835 RepID=A0A504YUQ7_FASGI|nr:Major vault protein [Fasciola gigantica]
MEGHHKERCAVIRIAQYQYVHVFNENTNVTRLVLGPRTYVCLKDEKISVSPTNMISVPPMHSCLVENPILKSPSGDPVFDANGQVKLRLGCTEYRFHQDPFPLYPGEKLKSSVEKLPVVNTNQALCLRALVDFVDGDGLQRIAGQRWLFEGPGESHIISVS